MAEKHAHTPGPWRYGPADNYDGFSIAPEMRLPTLAAVHNFPGQTEANARLIAQAPAMLEALRACHVELTWCKAQLASEGYESREGGSVCEALRMAHAAIAAATGEAP